MSAAKVSLAAKRRSAGIIEYRHWSGKTYGSGIRRGSGGRSFRVVGGNNVGLYPLGLILLLSVALVVAVAVAVERHRVTREAESQKDPGQRQHDAATVRELPTTLPRSLVEWLRSQDFGGSAWPASYIDAFFDLRRQFDDIEHRVFYPELQRALDALMSANDEFVEVYLQNTFQSDLDAARA